MSFFHLFGIRILRYLKTSHLCRYIIESLTFCLVTVYGLRGDYRRSLIIRRTLTCEWTEHSSI